MFNRYIYIPPAKYFRWNIELNVPKGRNPINYMRRHLENEFRIEINAYNDLPPDTSFWERKKSNYWQKWTLGDHISHKVVRAGLSLMPYGKLYHEQLEWIVRCLPNIRDWRDGKMGRTQQDRIPPSLLPLPLELRRWKIILDETSDHGWTRFAWIEQADTFLEWCLAHLDNLKWHENYGRYILTDAETQQQLKPFKYLWKSPKRYILLAPLPIILLVDEDKPLDKTIRVIHDDGTELHWVKLDTDSLPIEICSEIAHRLAHAKIPIIPGCTIYNKKGRSSLLDKQTLVLIKINNAPPEMPYVVYDLDREAWINPASGNQKLIDSLLSAGRPILNKFPGIT